MQPDNPQPTQPNPDSAAPSTPTQPATPESTTSMESTPPGSSTSDSPSPTTPETQDPSSPTSSETQDPSSSTSSENQDSSSSDNPDKESSSKEPKKKLNLKGEVKLSDIKAWFKAHKKEVTAETTGNYEINLIPDIKSEMNRTLKTRNLVFFICLIISIVIIAGTSIIWSIIGGQNIVMSDQDNRLDLMSKKLNSYSSVNELLTIQDQVNKISVINDNRKLFSRAFTILDAMRPRDADTVSYSEVNVLMDSNTLLIEGQADAGKEPLIDYRVLDAYKKNSLLLKYDYGRYVTAENNEIPTYCIREVDKNGNAYIENGRYFAYWTRNVEGCDPDAQKNEGEDEDNTTINLLTPSLNVGLNSEQITTDAVQDVYELGDKIYRTPLIATGGGEWYKKGYINDSGEINGVEHFASECISYSTTGDEENLTWIATNECMVTDSGLEITESSNGRDENEKLVLRFEGSIELNPEVLSFNNKHMMIINPSARNVTDSYIQIEDMFVKPASNCEETDTDCKNTLNSIGNNNED